MFSPHLSEKLPSVEGRSLLELLEILLQGRPVSSPMSINVFNHLFLSYGFVDVYLMLWVVIQDDFLAVVPTIPALATGALSVGPCTPLRCSHHCGTSIPSALCGCFLFWFVFIGGKCIWFQGDLSRIALGVFHSHL